MHLLPWFVVLCNSQWKQYLYVIVFGLVKTVVLELKPGGRLNKKDRLTGYGDPHVKDKTSYRPSYL